MQLITYFKKKTNLVKKNDKILIRFFSRKCLIPSTKDSNLVNVVIDELFVINIFECCWIKKEKNLIIHLLIVL